jgi:para-nitrobenzyl esterase
MTRPLVSLVMLAGVLACGGPSPTNDAGVPDAGATADAGLATVDAGACGGDVTLTPGTVRTSSGAFTGQPAGATWAFRGLPYAEPPVGALRFRPPVARGCEAGPHTASAFGHVCPQRQSDGGVTGDEDCLTLNVWAPTSAMAAPVLVFLHGGGNVQGSSADPVYDGQTLATATHSVVVTLNYRLGALGFLTHPGLDAESDAGVSGNYGVMDQQLALRWVQENVAQFGGDPAKVLLFGESAGALDALVHFVAPGSAGLMRAVLSESGGLTTQRLAEAETEHAQVVTAMGCASAADVPACLRALSADTLAGFAAGVGPLDPSMHFRPVVDGVVLPDLQRALISRGAYNHVTLVLGSNADETSRMVPAITTDAQYQAQVQAYFGAASPQVLAHYPSSDFSTPRQALVRVTTDTLWTCATRQLARAVAAQAGQPVYRYFFSWHAPGAQGQVVGASHALELPFVFQSFSALGYTPAAGDTALSSTIEQHWGALAATGAPASGWPAWDASMDATLELNAPTAVLDGVRTADCDFLDMLAP